MIACLYTVSYDGEGGPRLPDPTLRNGPEGAQAFQEKCVVVDGLAGSDWKKTFPWTAELRKQNQKMFGYKKFRWVFMFMTNTHRHSLSTYVMVYTTSV